MSIDEVLKMWPYFANILQAIAMLFDEFYFHEKRGLPKWERLGHPLDTFTVLSCYLWIISNSYSSQNLKIFIFFCIFSSVFITKDEFIHNKHCSQTEQWLHSVLFILHPLTFLSSGYLWFKGNAQLFLQVQTMIIFLFMIYQIIRWNLYGFFQTTKNK